jgi:hypothetical protein
MSIEDLRGQGPPGDVGTFQFPASVVIYRFTFSGTTYVCAARHGDRGWVLVDYLSETPANTSIVLQAALAVSGLIVISSGTFTSTTALLPPDNMVLQGSGVGSTVLRTTSNNTILYIASASPKSNVTVKDLTIDLTDATDGAIGVNFEAGNNLRLQNIKVLDANATVPGVGVVAAIVFGKYHNGTNLVTEFYVENVIVDRAGNRNGIPLGLYWVTNGHVTGSRFKERDVGVAIDPAKSPCVGVEGIFNVKFIGDTIELAHHNGVFSSDDSITGYYSRDVTFVECTFQNNGDDATDFNHDVLITFSNCTFIDNEFYAVSFEDNCRECVIAGNTVSGGEGIGIGGCSILTITGNNLYQVGGATPAILVQGISSDVVIEGNTTYDWSTGIAVQDATTQRVWISGNTIYVGTYNKSGITITDAQQVHVHDNYIIGWAGAAVLYIQPIIMSGAPDGCTIENNIILAQWESTFKFLGAKTKVRRNLFYQDVASQRLGMKDFDGTMTGVAGTDFTYEDQKGIGAGLSTAAVALVQVAVTFPVQYPSGGAQNGGPPKVYLTLKNPTAAFVGTVWVDQVTVTGFRLNLNVHVAGGAGATVDVQWESNLPESW